jgi:FAD/FMN-containing dehydrogenase
MGVVTWGVIKFEHLPRLSKAFFIPFEKLDEAIQPLYRIQRRMIGNECFLLDRVNLATILADDWPADFKPLIKSLPEWSLILILSGAPRRPEEKIAYEEKALREIGAQFPGIALLDSLPGVPRAERELPELLRKPWTKDKVYWKHRLKGGSQDLFFIAKLSKIPEMAERVNQLAQKFDYPSDEIGGYIQPIEQGRACHGEFNFYFDPNSPDEVAKCQALYFESAKSLFEAGAHFSRPYGILAEIVYQKATSYTIMLKKVKNIFDPHNIMNPGKLCF